MRKQTGAALRRWRRQRGLTQSQLAERVGRKPQSISRYEQGDDDPNQATVRALDEALDAGGEIIALYGLTPQPAMDEIRQAFERLAGELQRQGDLLEPLDQRLARTGEQLADLGRLLDELAQRVGRLERRRGR